MERVTNIMINLAFISLCNSLDKKFWISEDDIKKIKKESKYWPSLMNLSALTNESEEIWYLENHLGNWKIVESCKGGCTRAAINYQVFKKREFLNLLRYSKDMVNLLGLASRLKDKSQ